MFDGVLNTPVSNSSEDLPQANVSLNVQKKRVKNQLL